MSKPMTYREAVRFLQSRGILKRPETSGYKARIQAARERCRKAIKETPWKKVVAVKPETSVEDNHYWLHGRSRSNYTGD